MQNLAKSISLPSPKLRAAVKTMATYEIKVEHQVASYINTQLNSTFQFSQDYSFTHLTLNRKSFVKKVVLLVAYYIISAR